MMTKKERRRMEDLMLRDLGESHRESFRMAVTPAFPLPVRGHSTVEVIRAMERAQMRLDEEKEEHVIDRIRRNLGREELFRFAYVPFAIAELVWDYADTVICCATLAGNPQTKRLSRAIREARSEFDSYRRGFIDGGYRNRELKNGYQFEEGVSGFMAQLVVNVRGDVLRKYPGLDSSGVELLVAVHQCRTLSDALLEYIAKQREVTSKRIGSKIGKLFPDCYYRMHSLLPEFLGDCGPSDYLKGMLGQYKRIFVGEISRIMLDEIL